MLNIYNKQFLLINEPRYNYAKLKIVFEKLNSNLFIFPESFDLTLNNVEFYSYIDSMRNFNELKINNSFFKPELLITKIEMDHVKYLNKVNKIYNTFSYNLIYFASYKKFSNNFDIDINEKDNYFKYFIFNEDLKANCNKRFNILNTISYKFIKPFVEKYVSSIKYESFINITNINKDLLKINNVNSNYTSELTNITLKKILKITNHSAEYHDMIKNLFDSNIDKIITLYNNFINNRINSYFFIDINYKIIELLTEHISYNILNYPKDIIYFVNKSNTIPPPLNNIENFENNAFDLDGDNIIDEIWDPDDDNDFVKELRILNPKLDEYYQKYFVVADNKTMDKGAYLSHINILEKQLFDFIKNTIKSREIEMNSLFYAAAQHSEKEESSQYLNALISVINDYLTDIVKSDIYKEIDIKFLPNHIINMLIKNIYIDNDLLKSFFNNYDFSRAAVSTSKAIEYSVLNKLSKLISEFFESKEFKLFLFSEFFNDNYLKTLEQRFPNSRDDLINNLTNLINSFKFTFIKDIYNGNLFQNLKDTYKDIYKELIPGITEDDILDIYENYQLSTNLQIDEFRSEIKNVVISSTYAMYIDLFIDSFRINKKFENI